MHGVLVGIDGTIDEISTTRAKHGNQLSLPCRRSSSTTPISIACATPIKLSAAPLLATRRFSSYSSSSGPNRRRNGNCTARRLRHCRQAQRSWIGVHGPLLTRLDRFVWTSWTNLAEGMIVFQCGIQVGQTLLHSILSECPSDAVKFPFSTYEQIIVDTEQKTWHSIANNKVDPCPTTFVDCGVMGRGNNWASGFLDSESASAVMDAHRRMLERADPSAGTRGSLLIHSIAGGTGSGLGSRLMQELKETEPKRYLLTASVAPFHTGETGLQHYNSLLSLANAYECADLITFFSNDDALDILNRRSVLRGSKGLLLKADGHSIDFYSEGGARSQVSLFDMNKFIADALCGILLPTTPVTLRESTSSHGLEFDGWGLITQVAPVPQARFALAASSFTHDSGASFLSWEDACSDLLRNLPLKSQHKRSHIGSLLIARGVAEPAFWSALERFRPKILTRLGRSPASQKSLKLISSSCFATNIRSTKKSLSICSSTTDVTLSLDSILDSANTMFESGAYLHWALLQTF
ncbi:Tubulin/FtsZ family, GTPase domain-containing protein [Zopfochytrium polystomum]|nr:Tubulin/FtsZ family, GTPase domain-containing protein [Zopfochytrium polystomum]